VSNDEFFGRDDEMSASGPRFPGGLEPRVLSGTFAGARWQVSLDPRRPRIAIDGREVHVSPDGFGNFVSHAMFGRWSDLAILAQAIVRYHPDYSPLARRRDEPVA
jgi:hypothetical protein